MKKSMIVLIFLNVLSSLAMTVFFSFSHIQIEVNTSPPYRLSSNAVCFRITENMNKWPTEKDREKAIRAFTKIVEDNDFILVADDIDNIGLGLYDAQGYFNQFSLEEGSYFNGEINRALVLKGSYTLKNFASNNTYKSMKNKSLVLSGIYDKKHPLYNIDKEYIFNYFYEPSLSGDFYIDSSDYELLNRVLTAEIIPMFEEHNYTISISSTYNWNLISLVVKIISNPSYFLTLVTLLFIFANLCIYYIATISRWKKVFRIYYMIGSTQSGFVKHFCKKLFPFIAISSILGPFVYCAFFNESSLNVPLQIFAFSIITHIILSMILLAFSLILKTNFKHGIGDIK